MKETKQRQIITIVMIIAAIISVSIASYAAFTYNFEGEESQINKEQICVFF